jgi:hypothetical protein
MQILPSWVYVSSQSKFSGLQILSTYISWRRVAQIVGNNFPNLFETATVRVQLDLVSCSCYVLHFHIVPTEYAACARELLIVMTAKILCRLVVTTRFVEVEFPYHGSGVLHVGYNKNKKDDNAYQEAERTRYSSLPGVSRPTSGCQSEVRR